MYRALRNVCIGVDRHVSPSSEPFELDAGTAQYLISIAAVAKVDEPAPAPAVEPQAALELAPAVAPAEPAKAETPQAPNPTKDAKASKKGT